MSLSDYSDLTELSSSEDEQFQPATKSKKSKKQPKQYKITNVLRPPRTTQYTAKSLYDQIIDNSIDLDPEYQRDIVWSDEKQTGLIDSILRNYYMPPIIFAVSAQEDGSELRTCIDGKQRLTSIQKFIDGQIPHKDSYTNEKLWYKASASNPRRKVLPAHLRAIFANKQVVCVEYSDLTDDQEREIFQRVQLGVALTPAERLQAIVGPWPAVIRDIQSHILGEEGFEGYLEWGHARGRDFHCLATIGHLIEHYPKSSIPSPKVLERWLHGTDPVKKSLITDLQDTFRIFVILARDKQYSGPFKRPTRVSPIEFVMTGVLIYLKKSSLSFTQLSSAIEKMRKDVRASEKDIRANTRVTKFMLDFMHKRLKVSELKKDGKGDTPATIAARELKASVKRKRPVEGSDDESESELPPRKVAAARASSSTTAKTASKATKSIPTKKVPQPTSVATESTKTQPAVSRKSTAGTKSSESSKQSTPKLPAKQPAPNFPMKPPAVKPASTPVVVSTARGPPVPAPQQSPALSKPPPHSISISATMPAPTIKAEPMVPSLTSSQFQSPSVPSPITQSSLMDRLAPIRAAKAALVGSDSGIQPNQVAQTGTPNPVPSSFGQPHLLAKGSAGASVSPSGNLLRPLPPKPSTSFQPPPSSQHSPQEHFPPSQHSPPPQQGPPSQYLPPSQHPPHPQHAPASQYPQPPHHPIPPPHSAPPQYPPSQHLPPTPRSVHPAPSSQPPQAPRHPTTHTMQQQQSNRSVQGSHALPPRPPPTGPSFASQQHARASMDSSVTFQGSYSHPLPARPPSTAPGAPMASHLPPPPRSFSIDGGPYPEGGRHLLNTVPERRQSFDERRSTARPGSSGYNRDYGGGRSWERDGDLGRSTDRRDSWGRERDPHRSFGPRTGT